MAGYSVPALPVNLCFRATESTLASAGKCYYFIFVTAVNKPMGVTASGAGLRFLTNLHGEAEQSVQLANCSLPDIHHATGAF